LFRSGSTRSDRDHLNLVDGRGAADLVPEELHTLRRNVRLLGLGPLGPMGGQPGIHVVLTLPALEQAHTRWVDGVGAEGVLEAALHGAGLGDGLPPALEEAVP